MSTRSEPTSLEDTLGKEESTLMTCSTLTQMDFGSLLSVKTDRHKGQITPSFNLMDTYTCMEVGMKLGSLVIFTGLILRMKSGSAYRKTCRSLSLDSDIQL